MKSQEIIDSLDKLGDINKHAVVQEYADSVNNIENKANFIHILSKGYESNFLHGFLLTFPVFLKALSLNHWLEIIKLNFPRSNDFKKNIKKNIQNDSDYSDIIFLHKYLNINPVETIKQLDVNEAQKKDCIEFIKSYTGKFLIDKNELEEDLEDFYNVTYDELNEYSESLIKDGFKKGFQTENELMKYLEEL